jgi:hypothetical protein
MKKTITLLMLASAFQFCLAQDSGPVTITGNGHTDVQKPTNLSHSANRAHYANNSAALFPCDTLQTTFAGGNNHRGNMFDIVAINAVNIISFDAHPVGNTDYEIYYKVGTFAGSENNSAAWTLVGSATGVVAQPMGTPTPLPIVVNITIPAGQTYGWYVTSTNTTVSNYYTNGTAQGSVYTSDANIQFLEGVGLEYPFTGTPFTPRVWNGRIHYCDAATGIETILGTMPAQVFPNPVSTSAMINLHSSASLKNAELKLYNVMGEEAATISNINSNEIIFNRGNLSAGMYFFVVKEENALITKGKLTIE